MRLVRRYLPLAMMALLAGPAAAEPAADSDVVLTLVGAPGAVKVMLFNRHDLEQMRVLTVRTSTIWTEGVIEFRGVPLSEILHAAGITQGKLMLYAANDYAAEIPVSEILADVPILAFEVNGAPMARRDKGPLWVVYPYDESPAYQTEITYTRSVWQLERIEVLP